MTMTMTLTKWRRSLAQGVVAGSLASVLSIAGATFASRRQTGSGAAAVNAISHWLWGDDSLYRNSTKLTYTGVGYATHHAASVFWGTLYAVAAHDRPATRTPTGIALGALATSAFAAVVDYQVVPKRFTPGFEHRLSTGAMVGVYALLALGLGVGALAMRNRYNDRDSDSDSEDFGPIAAYKRRRFF